MGLLSFLKLFLIIAWIGVWGSGFRVQGCGGGFAANIYGAMPPKVVFKSPVTHSYLQTSNGMKKSGGIVSSAPLTKAPYPPLARSPFPEGEGYDTRMPLSPKHSLSRVGKVKRRRLRRKKGSQPRLAAPLAPSKGRGSRGRSLLPMEGGAPKGRRLDAAIPDTKSSRCSEGGDVRKCSLYFFSSCHR